MFSDERLAEMVLGTIESPSASASHRPLRLVLDSRSIDDEVHSIAADTGVGCSTMYAEVGLLLGIDPGPVNISHGAGFSRQVLPRHGPIKQQVGQLPHTLELQGRLTLHGGMGKRGLSTSATTSAASSSTMVDSRPLPKKRSRKGKTPDTADVQQLLEMFAEEEEAEEQQILAEMGMSDDELGSNTSESGDILAEDEEEEDEDCDDSCVDEEGKELECQDGEEPGNAFGTEQVDELGGEEENLSPGEHNMEEPSRTQGGNTANLHDAGTATPVPDHTLSSEKVAPTIIVS